MKCQSLFSGKNKKNIINLLSAEFAQSMVSVSKTIKVYKKEVELINKILWRHKHYLTPHLTTGNKQHTKQVETFLHFACLVNISADNILKYFFSFSPWRQFTCPMDTIHMKCQSLFSGKNKKNIINLSSAEFDHSKVSVNFP